MNNTFKHGARGHGARNRRRGRVSGIGAGRKQANATPSASSARSASSGAGSNWCRRVPAGVKLDLMHTVGAGVAPVI